MTLRVIHGDCVSELPRLATRFHSAVTDPPYELGFMGKKWDATGVSFRPETWRAVYDVLLPGAHLVAFGGTRTQHRMVSAIEDAGFEIRDTLMWVYGSGFAKSHNVSKGIDKRLGGVREVSRAETEAPTIRPSHINMDQRSSKTRERRDTPATPEAAQWQGWGTALKPSWEPIILARKPLDGTVAANVLAHGVGGINIDACRVPTTDGYQENCVTQGVNTARTSFVPAVGRRTFAPSTEGRWPSNTLHDGSAEVMAAFAEFAAPGQQGRAKRDGSAQGNTIYGALRHVSDADPNPRGDSGSAARFFPCCPWSEGELRMHYSGKADAADRAASKHPTVKPQSLMQWLVQLVTPPGGHVIDPFAGSGSTGEACMVKGFDCTMIELDPQNARDIQHRIDRWSGKDMPLFRDEE